MPAEEESHTSIKRDVGIPDGARLITHSTTAATSDIAAETPMKTWGNQGGQLSPGWAFALEYTHAETRAITRKG
jgi:hypothetical protein